MKNKNSTRAYSDAHEKSVCEALGAVQQSNSGAGLFNKGDCVQKGASMLIECKTVMKPKESVSIKKEWVSKNKREMRDMGLFNSCVAFNFEPDGANYYVINEELMTYLVENLSKDYSEL